MQTRGPEAPPATFRRAPLHAGPDGILAYDGILALLQDIVEVDVCGNTSVRAPAGSWGPWWAACSHCHAQAWGAQPASRAAQRQNHVHHWKQHPPTHLTYQPVSVGVQRAGCQASVQH